MIKIEKYFAYFPTKVGSKWVWFQTYLIGYEVETTNHYCHDCFNPVVLCSIGYGTPVEIKTEVYRVLYKEKF